jgi:hypothetical protein
MCAAVCKTGIITVFEIRCQDTTSEDGEPYCMCNGEL